MRTETAFHFPGYRVCQRKKARTPDHWGVQRSIGYADGTIAWRLATNERFWSQSSAEAWIEARKQLDTGKAAAS